MTKFEWYGLQLVWNITDKHFDNVAQSDRWAFAVIEPEGTLWRAELTLRSNLRTPYGRHSSPEVALENAIEALSREIDDALGRAGMLGRSTLQAMVDDVELQLPGSGSFSDRIQSLKDRCSAYEQTDTDRCARANAAVSTLSVQGAICCLCGRQASWTRLEGDGPMKGGVKFYCDEHAVESAGAIVGAKWERTELKL